MTDRRRKTREQKAKTYRARIARRLARQREQDWLEAAQRADDDDLPLNFALTVTFRALAQETCCPAFMALSDAEKAKAIWAALRRVAASNGVEWIAARAPEYDSRKGPHLHVAAHMPDAVAMQEAVAAIERVTGAPAAWQALRGRRLGRVQGVIAISPGGGWMAQRDMGSDRGNPGLLRYVAKGAGKHRAEGQHRLSNALCALMRD